MKWKKNSGKNEEFSWLIGVLSLSLFVFFYLSTLLKMDTKFVEYWQIFVCTGLVIGPIVTVIISVGNSAVVIGLWPAHFIWTYYCVAKYVFSCQCSCCMSSYSTEYGHTVIWYRSFCAVCVTFQKQETWMGFEDCVTGIIASSSDSLAHSSHYWKSYRWDRVRFSCSFDCNFWGYWREYH